MYDFYHLLIRFFQNLKGFDGSSRNVEVCSERI